MKKDAKMDQKAPIFDNFGSQNAPNGSLVGPFWGLGSALGHFGRPGDPKAAQGTPF